jgi:AP-3 complex subunit delta-1
VQAAAVNVICELATRNPSSYLTLVPTFYDLLINNSNNWMLIKVVKLFSALTPIEPRLVRKLKPNMFKLIQTTSALSVLHEAIHCVVVGSMLSESDADSFDSEMIQLIVLKLKLLVTHKDPNLKGLGLITLSKLLEIRPLVISSYSQVVLDCLDDQDVSIRAQALKIVQSMVSKDNLPDIVHKLMLQIIPNSKDSDDCSFIDVEYKNTVCHAILDMVSEDTYDNVEDFEWLIQNLIQLSFIPDVDPKQRLSFLLIDVCIRVVEVRAFATMELVSL